jgi:hypothetical protein
MMMMNHRDMQIFERDCKQDPNWNLFCGRHETFMNLVLLEKFSNPTPRSLCQCVIRWVWYTPLRHKGLFKR